MAFQTGNGSDPNDAASIGQTLGPGITSGNATVAEFGGAKKAILTFNNAQVVMQDNPGVVAFGKLKIATLPAGYVLIMGATTDLAITKSSGGVIDTWDGDFALGTAQLNNDNALNGAEANIIPSTATPQAVAGATTAKGASTGTEAPKIHDGHTTAIDVFLNMIVDDTDHDVTGTPCNLVLNGIVTIVYGMLGDN